MDKAQKYTDKAIAQIDKLKNSPGEKNKTILVEKYSEKSVYINGMNFFASLDYLRKKTNELAC